MACEMWGYITQSYGHEQQCATAVVHLCTGGVLLGRQRLASNAVSCDLLLYWQLCRVASAVPALL